MQAQPTLQGLVIDSENGEPLLLVNLKLFQNGVFQTGCQSDFDGRYRFAFMEPGEYDLELNYTGYRTMRIEGVEVRADGENILDVSLTPEVQAAEVEVVGYDQMHVYQEDVRTENDESKLPGRSVNDLADVFRGSIAVDSSNQSIIRGPHAERADYYYLDGIRIKGSPATANEFRESIWQYAPNSGTGIVGIETIAAGGKVRVYDSSGRLLLTEEVPGKRAKIDLSGEKGGKFLFICEGDGGVESVEIIWLVH